MTKIAPERDLKKEDKRTPRERILGMALAVRDLSEPNKRMSVFGLVKERLRPEPEELARAVQQQQVYFAHRPLTQSEEEWRSLERQEIQDRLERQQRRETEEVTPPCCTIAEILAAAYPDPDEYWRLWITIGLERSTITPAHFLAAHAATRFDHIRQIETLLREPAAACLLTEPADAPLRQRLTALMSDPDYNLAVPELRTFLGLDSVRPAEPTSPHTPADPPIAPQATNDKAPKKLSHSQEAEIAREWRRKHPTLSQPRLSKAYKSSHRYPHSLSTFPGA